MNRAEGAPVEMTLARTGLEQVFEAFNRAAANLGTRYQSLSEEIQDLKDRLAAKNRELEANLVRETKLRNRLKTVIENLGAGVLVADENHRISLSNRLAEEILGAPDGLSGRHLAEVLPELLKIEEGGPSPSTTPQTVPSRRLLEGKEKGTVVAEARLGLEGGTETRLILSRPSEADPESATVVVLQDETRIKRLEARLRRRDRLAAMGTISAQIVHEIRNPLGSLELLTSILAGNLGEDPANGDIVHEISSSITKLNRTLTNIMTFLGNGFLQKRTVQLADLLGGLVQQVPAREIRGGVEFVVQASPEDLAVCVDPELLTQSLLNLVLNAVQAMPEGGRLRLTGDAIPPSPEGGGVWSRVVVEDEGVGIPADHLDRIFDPFFSTRRGGTGLGLTIAHNLIEAHGGSLEITSRPGKGTRCTILLPDGGNPRRGTTVLSQEWRDLP